MARHVETMIVMLLIAKCTFAQEPPVYSGPQVGEKLPTLELVDGLDRESQEFDWTAKTDGKPSLLIFIHDLLANKSDEPSLGLSYVLSHYAAERRDAGLTYGVVYLADDVSEMRAFLTKIQRALPKKGTPLMISTDGLEGPGAWGLNRNLRMTVVISQENQVTANFALQQPSVEFDAPRILAKLIETIGGKVPTLAELDFPYYIGRPDTMKGKPQ
ncbi:MAG: hypothetical protein NXI32_26515 [bacterium]|nr:hypothetical protein [bacterium]